MRTLRNQIARIGPRRATTLVTGETGTGKERVAEACHAVSPRAHNPLVRVNCAALSEGVLESELFGHERGAFTGAHARRAGRFELADGGSLLLDEIGELSPRMQLKLLGVLQEQRFERVGGNQTLAVDVRVVATTHRDLRAMVDVGAFREDLYYRLAVLEIEVPPLRERRADVPLLVEHTLARMARELGVPPPRVSDEALDILARHPWPGNVRELENTLERALAVADRDEITAATLPPVGPSPRAERRPGGSRRDLSRDRAARHPLDL